MTFRRKPRRDTPLSARTSGYTLIELMVVVTIIGILAALTAAIPSVKDAIFVDGWALLTYLWATLLLLLGVTLLLQGLTYLFRLFVPRRGE